MSAGERLNGSLLPQTTAELLQLLLDEPKGVELVEREAVVR